MVQQVVIVVVFIAFFVGLPGLMITMKRKQKAAFEAAATQMGFSYEGMGDESVARCSVAWRFFGIFR